MPPCKVHQDIPATIGNIAPVISCCHTRKYSYENCPQFGHAPSERIVSHVLGQKKKIIYQPGGPQIISLPSAPSCSGAGPSTRLRGYMLRHMPPLQSALGVFGHCSCSIGWRSSYCNYVTSHRQATTQRSRGKESPRHVLYLFQTNRKVRVKFTLDQATKAERGRSYIALLFL